MFERKLRITILGDSGPLCRQTLNLCGRWTDCYMVDVGAAEFGIDHRRALDSDLIFICLQQVSMQENTRDIEALLTELEKANNGLVLNNVVLRTRAAPGSSERWGVHIMHSYGSGSAENFWLLGLNPDSEPMLVASSMDHFLKAAFEDGKLREKPVLRKVNAAEAEATWFARLALVACEKKFFKETKVALLGRQAVDHKVVLNGILESFPENLDASVPTEDLCAWIDEIGSTATPLLNAIL